jgi:hypothetical protein
MMQLRNTAHKVPRKIDHRLHYKNARKQKTEKMFLARRETRVLQAALTNQPFKFMLTFLNLTS